MSSAIASTRGPDAPLLRTKKALVAGATGFVGHHVVLELLRRGWDQVLCFTRKPGALTPLLSKLAALPGWEAAMADRVKLVVGDLTQPCLGCADYEILVHTVHAVVHVAEMRWTDDAIACRQAHLVGTRNLLALATHGCTKAFIYLSSLAAAQWVERTPTPLCGHALDDPAHIHDETCDWGYARGKWDSEQLVIKAKAAGLAAHIVRPTVVWGNSETGKSSTQDLLAAFIRGSVHMQTVPDMEWYIDATPVNATSQAMAALCDASPDDAVVAPFILQLMQVPGRHWRGFILWLDLHGYPMRLVSYGAWRALLRENTEPETEALRALLPFYTRAMGDTKATFAEWYATPDWYARKRAPTPVQAASEAWLQAQGIEVFSIDDAYIGRVIGGYVAQGWLPPVIQLDPSESTHASRPPIKRLNTPEEQLREALHHVHPNARIDRIEPILGKVDDSIVMATTAVNQGDVVVLRAYRLHGQFENPDGSETGQVDVMFKRKAHSDIVCDVVKRVAALAHPHTGEQINRAMSRLDVPDLHHREIAVYHYLHASQVPFVPRLWGSILAPERRLWLLVMSLETPLESTPPWTNVLPMAIQAMAQVQAPWLERYAQLEADPLMGERRTSASKVALLPLWEALTRHTSHAVQMFLSGAPKDLPKRVLEWLVPRWHHLDALPKTMIHNDFAARNSFVKEGMGGPELCIYDWELAKVGPPQLDLASYLCLLPEGLETADIPGTIAQHREQLMRASGVHLDEDAWMRGMQLALSDFMLDRMALWSMMHRVRPSYILPQALRSWLRLAEVAELPIFGP